MQEMQEMGLIPGSERSPGGDGRCIVPHSFLWVSQVELVLKNPLASAEDARVVGSIPGWGRSLGEGNGNPLQYSCLENPMDRGAWWATVHGAARSRT